MKLFWIFWGIDALVALIAIYFFVVGLADGSVSANNIMLWLLLLGTLMALLAGGLYLKSAGKLLWANALLGVLAVPAFLFCLFFIVAIASDVRWN